MNPFDLFDDDGPRKNDSFKAFFRDVLSNTFSTVLATLILGVVFVIVLAVVFQIKFLTSLGLCAFLGLCFLGMKITGNI